jgi:sugar phosphate permease
MLTSLQISAIIGSPLAGWILGVTAFGLKGWQLLFVLEAFPAVIFGIVLLCILDDSPSDAKWLDPDEKDYLERKLLQENELKLSARRYTILEALTDREVLKLCFIYFLWITGFWGFNYWIPTALREMSGWSNLALGSLIVIPMTLSLASMLGVAWSSSKTGEKRLHGAVSMFAGAAGFGFGAFASDPLWAFGLVCVTAAGVFAAFGVWWSYPTTFLSGAAAAGAVGLINSFGNIGGYAGPYITGFIRDTAGSFHWAYITLSCSLAAAGLLMLTLRHGVQHEKSV